ncbi:hypothetical protein KY311_02110 [Candidatus Woesearchaeota archaeon]|nr:hypothetical protein [Candidatus Woesearchaeota archaeon]
MDEEKEIFYVGIKDPSMLRRSLLESSKDIVVFLKTFENLKKLRIQKFEHMQRLNVLVEEISRMINKFQRDLPKTRLRVKAEEVPKPKAKKKAEPKPKKVKMSASEVEKLELELKDIEEKLSKLA